MASILVVNKFQFGYHTDVTKWCEFLRPYYDVKTFTLDEGKPMYFMDNVQNTYVSTKGSKLVFRARFLIKSMIHILFHRGPIIMCCFTQSALYKKLMPWKKMILDVRTMDVSTDGAKRDYENNKIREAVKLYDAVSAISPGVVEQLKTPKHVEILPLGADSVQSDPKDYSKLRLVYVGTFNNRHIDKTIIGFAQALSILPEADIHYHIIGDGANGELNAYKKLVKKLELENHITLHGYLQHDRVKEFMKECNIGVSFVPITEYYQHQPVTKTFEYALSGLYTIATNTYSNREVITDTNGILIDDTPEAFAESVCHTYNKRASISEVAIRDSLKQYEWKNIVENVMLPFINRTYLE